MTETLTIDDIARTSDEAAVRRQFDARTLGWLRLLSTVLLVVMLPHVLFALGAAHPRRILLATVGFAVAALVYLATRKSATHRMARFVRERARAVAITFGLTEAAVLIFYQAPGEGAVALSVIIPFAFIGFRLLPAEHVLAHTGLAGIATLVLVLMPFTGEPHLATVMPPLMVNGLVLGTSLLVSRRARKQIIAGWSEWRASAREQVRMRDELQYARELQLSMLPDCSPDLDWIDICSISLPATEVGGDYYDYFVDEGRVALVCGDVAGHGMASGLVLAGLRSGFTLLRDSLGDPAAVLRRLHDLVRQTTRRRMLVTVSVVLLEKETRRATIASAGHPPVLIRRAGSEVETVALWAPPLGVRLPIEIPQREVHLHRGDVLVLHSDGIYEARNDEDESYGFERLEQVIRSRGERTAEELREAILEDVELFRRGAPQHDDMTLVIARLL
jgi:hypothetical protein